MRACPTTRPHPGQLRRPGPGGASAPVGDIGQLLPLGAGGNLLRSTGFFDGAGAGGHVAVLAAWALGGLGLLLAAEVRARSRRSATVLTPMPTA